MKIYIYIYIYNNNNTTNNNNNKTPEAEGGALALPGQVVVPGDGPLLQLY